jgi:hypothetical protein
MGYPALNLGLPLPYIISGAKFIKSGERIHRTETENTLSVE